MNQDVKRSYLDWAATAIPDITITDSVFGNPSSLHTEGRQAKKALESARCRCAQVLGVPADSLYFTSGGTEANALVLHSLLLRRGKGRLLYSGIEHPSVRENCLMLEKLGIVTGLIGVEKDGRVTELSLTKALEKYPDARFAALMAVNNETGARMDIAALTSKLRHRQKVHCHCHCDLVQAIGKVHVDIKQWDIDSAALSAHKLGGPRGIGLLYLKKPIESFYAGGGQEKGMRPGTENTSGALAMAAVLERRFNPGSLRIEEEKARERFKYLISELKKIKRCSLIPQDRGEDDSRFSPWILQVRFRGVPGAVMVRALDDTGVAVSTGSACSSNERERPVLAAMGLDETAQLEGVRISQGWSTDKSDFDYLLSGIKNALSFL